MGTSFVNYQIRSTAFPPGSLSVAGFGSTRALLTPEHNGWITLYDEASESQDSVEINRVAETLSNELHTTVFVFVVHSSEVLVYYLFDSAIWWMNTIPTRIISADR